jgi:hypothetical protein
MPFDVKTYACRGAEVRLAELQEEMATILQAFPDLNAGRQARGRRPQGTATVAVGSPARDGYGAATETYDGRPATRCRSALRPRLTGSSAVLRLKS